MANWLDKYEQGGLVLKQKTKDNYGKRENANEGYSTAGPGWVGEGTTNKGFDYNGAWGGTMKMGGALPGAVGFTYARTAGSAPANGKYTKKTKASAQNGTDIKLGNTPVSSFIENILINKNDKAEIQKQQDFVDNWYKNRKIFKDDGAVDTIKYPKISSDTKPIYTVKTDLGAYGKYDPTANEIKLNRLEDFAELGVPTHEYNHFYQSNPNIGFFPKKNKNRKIGDKYVLDPWEKGLRNNIDNITPEDMKYYLSPDEVQSRLMEIRYLNNLKPDQKVKPSDINNLKIPKESEYLKEKLKSKDHGLDWFLNNIVKNNQQQESTQAQNGTEMAFYQNGLDFTPKSISKNGSVIKDDLGQWAHPGEITEIDSNEITMQGVDYPVLGISDTGDTQMMYPDQDYKFDGDKVTEYPMAQDGGWLDKYQEGGTLMKDKKVGENITPINKLDLRPTYLYFDKQTEDVYDPNCPDGVGCSKQATDYAQKITGLPREKYAPADAAYRDAVAKRTGLINLFDQEGDQKTNANSNIEGWKYPKSSDFSNWKAGDIVTLDAGRDVYFGYKAPKGYMRSDNSGATHNGVIVGFMENGRPIIKHGYATEKNKGKSVTEILGDDGRVSSLGHGKYAIKSVWRPKEVDASGQINSIKNVIDTAEERAQRKQTTTSNSSFYLKPTKEEKLQKDYPVGAEFSGANIRLQTKNKLVNLFNDEKLDKDLQYKLGITSQELDKLKPVVYGVFGQESNFNDVDNAGASFKELIGNLFGNNSRGAAQIKMSSLTADEKKVLGIKKASDLDKDEVAYKAALLMLNNSRKRMNQEVEQGTHPELADKDEYFRAGYYYNSPARAIQSSEKFTKKKDKKATFSDIKKNELRMDEGSYPYKLMERAKDLGVNIEFDAASELEPVVVRSMVKNNKGTKFVPKQKTGGWLNKYK